MSMEARLRELSERHKRLEAAIAAELKHPAGDDVRIHELKRKKLRIKDEIALLQTEPHKPRAIAPSFSVSFCPGVPAPPDEALQRH
jgi:hypothetical protein